MKRPRQSQVLLAPLLDVVFIILLFYVASLIDRSREESADQAAAARALADERRRLEIDFADERERIFDAEQDLASARSQHRRLTDDLEILRREYQDLIRLAGAKDELLRQLEERFGSDRKARETAALLSAFERNFDIYEATFYSDRRIRIVTPKKDVYEKTIGAPEDLERGFRQALPAGFEPSRSVILVRAERQIRWYRTIIEFFEGHPDWITTLGDQQEPVWIDKDE